jgi:hypothetical protein
MKELQIYIDYSTLDLLNINYQFILLLPRL